MGGGVRKGKTYGLEKRPWRIIHNYDGTGTALTTNAYRIRSTSPIAVYQFNPLEEYPRFSADASLLMPAFDFSTQYSVLGWPQTIADTDDPATDMHHDFRAFLTIVGTQPNTSVSVALPPDGSLHVLGDGGEIPAMFGGDLLELELGAFEVLNLETDGFLADFTGTVVTADEPVAVFSGSEASDVPYFTNLAWRVCCADHLEQQLLPVGAQGTSFIAALTPSRIKAVREAGATEVRTEDEEEYFRILAFQDDTHVETTLDPPDDHFTLSMGEHRTLMSTEDFRITSDKPISVGQFVAGHLSTGIHPDLPAGDPAFMILAPEERWRRTYVFAIPEFYNFDFIIIAHPHGAEIHSPLPFHCQARDVEGTGGYYAVTRCQISFPQIPSPGEQNDGLHEITSDVPVGVVVYGFDVGISYGYLGG